MQASDVELRFWSKVNKTKSCWNWTATKSRNGYGQIKLSGNRQGTGAHRVSWEIAHGPIPQSLWVLHRCDNRACVNPDHLFLGTRKDNTNDMLLKSRQSKGASRHNAKLTESHVKIIRYVGRKLPQRIFMEEFGASETCIGNIVRGSTWKHVEIVQ